MSSMIAQTHTPARPVEHTLEHTRAMNKPTPTRPPITAPHWHSATGTPGRIHVNSPIIRLTLTSTAATPSTNKPRPTYHPAGTPSSEHTHIHSHAHTHTYTLNHLSLAVRHVPRGVGLKPCQRNTNKHST